MLKIDLHIHSLASGHSFNTVYEIAKIASEKGMGLIAITDHGPNMKGSTHLEYFSMAERVPKELFGVKILFGCEANIIDYDGTIDIPHLYLESLDFILVGFHKLTSYPENSTIEQNTTAMIKTIERYPIHAVAHPYRLDFPIFVEDIVKSAISRNVLLEINNSIFRNREYVHNDELLLKTREMIRFCKQIGEKLIIGSDAHIASEVGDDSNILYYWEALGLDNSLIITSKAQLQEYIKVK
ncbi:MAG: PHP domain-containing protein [Bacteroidetes bacterium]|nr:PHP domain-containing protein [Bacteroidota bacterium]